MTGFHAAFDAALSGEIGALRTHLRDPDRTSDVMAVYRNTVAKGRIDALAANYPTIVQMVGEAWFAAAASAFINDRPGDSPILLGYGEGFADWLSRFPPARAMPYLAPCARLDRAWTEAHLAADTPVLTVEAASRAGASLAGHAAGLHRSARLFWFDWTVPDLWLAHRYPDSQDLSVALAWRAKTQGLLIYRREQVVVARRLNREEWVFLDACRLGRPLGVALMAAQSDPVQGPRLFARLLAFQVLAAQTEEAES